MQNIYFKDSYIIFDLTSDMHSFLQKAEIETLKKNIFLNILINIFGGPLQKQLPLKGNPP